MKIAIPKERRPHERRVAATPDTVKKFITLGFQVAIESGAGEGSRFTDEAYRAAGASVVPDAAKLLADADLILKVQRPLLAGEGAIDELALMKKGSILIGSLAPYSKSESVTAYARAGITALTMEFVPRITRAQSMDILSSQSNLAGYRAVLDA